jgi:cell division protein FtsL
VERVVTAYKVLFILVLVLVFMLAIYLLWVVVKLTKLENRVDYLELAYKRDNRGIRK